MMLFVETVALFFAAAGIACGAVMAFLSRKEITAFLAQRADARHLRFTTRRIVTANVQSLLVVPRQFAGGEMLEPSHHDPLVFQPLQPALPSGLHETHIASDGERIATLLWNVTAPTQGQTRRTASASSIMVFAAVGAGT